MSPPIGDVICGDTNDHHAPPSCVIAMIPITMAPIISSAGRSFLPEFIYIIFPIEISFFNGRFSIMPTSDEVMAYPID